MAGKGLMAIGTSLMAKLSRNRDTSEPEWNYAEPASKTSQQFSRSVLGDPEIEKLKAAELETALSAPRSPSTIKIDSIEFPILELNDEWKVLAYEKAIKEFVGYYRSGWFSVSIVSDIMAVMGVSIVDVPIAHEYQKRLRLLHCIEFKTMTDNVKVELVNTLNACFRAIEDYFKPRERAIERFINRGNIYDAEYD